MTAGSDLDLIVVYDYEGDDAQSDGRKSRCPVRNIIRAFTQRLIAALSADDGGRLALPGGHAAQALGQSGPGRDQAIELRRLPDELGLDLGASRADPGARHHRARRAAAADRRPRSRRCWRARAIGRPSPRTSRPCAPGSPPKRAATNPWDLKHVRGGLIDLEFIAQFLQIVSAAEHPEALDQNTELALTKLSAAGVLSSGDAEVLVPAARLYHTLTQVSEALSRQAVRGGGGAARAAGSAGARRRHAGLRDARSDVERTRCSAVRRGFEPHREREVSEVN